MTLKAVDPVPNQDLIDAAKDILHQAETGNLRELILIQYTWEWGHEYSGVVGEDVLPMIGALEMAKLWLAGEFDDDE